MQKKASKIIALLMVLTLILTGTAMNVFATSIVK